MSKEKLKADIIKFFESLDTEQKYRIKDFQDNSKEIIWALIRSTHNDYKAFFLLCTSKEVSDDEVLSFDLMEKKCRTIFTWEYKDELAEGLDSDVYRFDFSEFNIVIPEDPISLTKERKLKLVELPKFKNSFKESRWSNLFTAFGDNTYRYHRICDDIEYEVQENIKSLMGVYSYDVYDVDHHSDESFLMQYIEWNEEPLCVVTKYADKSNYHIQFYSKEIEQRFINELMKHRKWDDDDQYIISDTDTESENYYGSTIIHNNRLYYTVHSPSYCYGYVKIENPHRCIMTSFDDIQMIPVSIEGYRKLDPDSYSSDILVMIKQNGVDLEVKPEEIFFLGGEHAPVLQK